MSSPAAKREAYQQLRQQTQALLPGERDWVTNCAQLCALVAHQVPALNWVGFYRLRGDRLILGPFQGKIACVEIPLSKGVCGACARTNAVQVVADVHTFPGHISCDAASRSEIVLPINVADHMWGVFDLDSPIPERFDELDAQGLSAILQYLVEASDWLPASDEQVKA